jgi:hypothetical protein
MPRTAAEEKRICLRIARLWLGGEMATVTKENLARLLFEQRQAIRETGEPVVPNDCCFGDVEVSDV